MAGNAKGGLIFVSCGQFAPAEVDLGNRVCALVRDLTDHEPYFAENQNSLEALTKHILGALDRAVGLIVILHPRGAVTFQNASERVRASVWIEQEIAIAAFITQILKRPLRIAPYIHADVKREGMREQLQLNAVSFTDDNDVLQHLRDLLPSWRDLPSSRKSADAPDVGIGLVSGRYPSLIFQFSNRENDDIRILRIALESERIELTDPWGPEETTDWKVLPGSTRAFSRNLTGPNPAQSLIQMNPPRSRPFPANLDVVMTCSFRGQQFKIQRTLRVQVTGSPAYIEQVV